MKKIRVGLVGFGMAGSVFHAPLIMAEPNMALSAIATSREIPADYPNVRRYASSEELIQDEHIDLVVIAVPNDAHFSLAKAALMAGKHVVVDKPFTLTVAEADSLIELASSTGRVLSIFHNRRWDGNFLTAKAVLDQGDIGSVNYCEINFDRFRPSPKTGWREEEKQGSGVLYDLGSHLIDQALCLFGGPDGVLADVTIMRDGVVADDYFHIQLTYGRSLRVVLHASCMAMHEGPRILLHGNQGSLALFGLDGQEDALKTGGRPGDLSWGVTEGASAILQLSSGEREIPLMSGSYQSYYRSVATAILDGTEPAVSAAQARDVISIIEAARRSSSERKWIELQLL